jgi:uncharacterized protein YbaP (TraB family)
MKSVIVFVLLFNNCLAQNTIIWEVSDTINNKKSFIVGTYHDIGNSFVDSIKIIRKTLLSAEVAVFESVDEREVVSNLLQQRTAQNEIKKLLSKQDYKKLKSISKNWEIDIATLKPIELLVILRREFQIQKCKTLNPADTWDHFDNYLIDVAKKNNIELVGLETDSIQLSILKEIQDSWGVDAVNQEISYWLSALTSTQNWYEECEPTLQYQKLEIDYEFTTDCEDDILNKSRNEQWITKLTEIVSTKNSFIAVGLLHLKYQCGLLESFRKYGFVVKPVIFVNNN